MKSRIYRKPREAVAASGTRVRKLRPASDSSDTTGLLSDLISRYALNRTPVTVNFRRILPQLRSTDRFTHLLHPYPAKLLHHIPFFFLANESISRPGDVVLDPFCGSGTVLLEAQLAGRNAVGADAN